jgi:hypothetical protein
MTWKRRAARSHLHDLATFVLATAGCALASAACASSAWPQVTGAESLATLRQAEEGEMVVGDRQFKAALLGCSDGEANSCAWITAYWKADYADARAKCAAGQLTAYTKKDHGILDAPEPCSQAAKYALGCATFRGYLSGGPEWDSFREAEVDVVKCDAPTWDVEDSVVQRPEPQVDVDKALDYVAQGCAAGKIGGADAKLNAMASRDCGALAKVFAFGIVNEFEVPRNLDLARKLYDREQALRGWDSDTKPEQRDADWKHQLAEWHADEEPAEHDARLQTIRAEYAKADASHQSMLQGARERASHSPLDAIAAGLNAGLATNAAVNSSLTTAQTNINNSAAAANARAQAHSAAASRASIRLEHAPAGVTSSAASPGGGSAGTVQKGGSASGPVCNIATPSQPGQSPGCACFANEQEETGEKLPGTTYRRVDTCAGTYPCCCSEYGGVLCQCSPVVAGATCKQVCDNTNGKPIASCSRSTPATSSP